MRLRDVDDYERHSVLVFAVELVKRGNLPAEWRSSVTAKDQNGRAALPGQLRQAHGCRLVEPCQREIGRGIPNLKMSGARPRPQCLKRKDEKRDWPRQLRHESREGLRRFRHDRVQSHAAEQPQGRDYCQRSQHHLLYECLHSFLREVRFPFSKSARLKHELQCNLDQPRAHVRPD